MTVAMYQIEKYSRSSIANNHIHVVILLCRTQNDDAVCAKSSESLPPAFFLSLSLSFRVFSYIFEYLLIIRLRKMKRVEFA